MAEGVLYTPNLDHLIKLQRDREFYDIYQRAEWIVCDSQILYLASKLLKRSLPMAIPGSSFFTAFYNYHANNPNCKIFLLEQPKELLKGDGEYKQESREANSGRRSFTLLRFREERTGV